MAPNARSFLCLDQITLQGVPNSMYRVELFVGDEQMVLYTEDNQTWGPAYRPVLSPASRVRVGIGVKRGHLPWSKKKQTSGIKEIDLQDLFDAFRVSTEYEITLSEQLIVGSQVCFLELRFSATATTDSLRCFLRKLEGLLMDYSPIMDEPTERVLDTVIKFGSMIAESNETSKFVFSVPAVVFDRLKNQNKTDRIPSDLFERLQRILPLVAKVADEIAYQETEFLAKIIQGMFEVVQTTVKFLCKYVKRGRFERVKDGLINSEVKETIETMDKELATIIEDFMRAVDVEALYMAQKIEEELLLGRFNLVDASYNLNHCCMKGTRQYILDDIKEWVAARWEGYGASRGNIYWFYGSPGIGKTSLAHSICHNLHDTRQLAGAFFCQRGHHDLSEPRNILPTLIHKLSRVFPPFRRIVAAHLRSDPHLTSKSMEPTLFLDFIRDLPCPNRDLVFVIDALDECGDDQSRSGILEVLVGAAENAPWLKIIVTSRPEADLQRFFNTLTRSSYVPYDLAMDQGAVGDLRTFARHQFNLVAAKWYLAIPWPEKSLFDSIISRANGLFIFVKTLVLVLQQCKDPEDTLKLALEDSAGTGSESLYKLYSSILKARIPDTSTEFQQVIGVLLATAPYRPLCEETIAELAGVKPNLVKKWVDDLSSLLYRDEGARGAIRIRHLSISDFFVSNHCDHQINLRNANMQLGYACLKTMIEQLRFNICKLEDSRLANADVMDLPSRIEENISDPLQYSSLYWSDHLCFSPYHSDQRVLGRLEVFFEGLYPLFWIEVLSVMGMVPIGAPSLRRVISWVKVADSPIHKRIQDLCRFIISFHAPISVSAPHTYISTQPFLPSQSALSTLFIKGFAKAIKVQRGKLLSWPAPPLEWIGHTLGLSCVSYSPNGCHIVTGSEDQTIRIWDAETGTAVGEPLSGHIDIVRSVAYSPDGRHIISGSEDKTIRIWDETGAAVGDPLKRHTGSVQSVAYSPGGNRIISGSDDNTIIIWDAETGAVIGRPLEGHTGCVWSVAYSPDGQHIISGSDDNTIRIWDAVTGDEVGEPLQGHTGPVKSVAYSSDGRGIVSGSSDCTIRIWDSKSRVSVNKPLEGHTASVWSIAYSPDGRYIISGSCDSTIRMWDAETGAAVGKPLEGHTGYVWSVAYSPDGRHIISGSDDRTLRVWDGETGGAVGKPREGHTGSIQSVAYSPAGQNIVSGSDDGSVQIWDAETGSAVNVNLRGHTEYVQSVSCSPDGQHIISGSGDHTIRIWDARTGAIVGMPLQGHTDTVTSVAYSPDGRHIASGSRDGTIHVWNPETGVAVSRTQEGCIPDVLSVAYSPDGSHIISGSSDYTIRVWDAKTGTAVGGPLRGHTGHVTSVAYSPDGQQIISGSGDNTIRIWDAETGATVGKPLEGHTNYVWSVAYSPDGRFIISGSGDRTIRIWDAKTCAPVSKPLKGHIGHVWSVAYSPDGRYIVSGSGDKTVRVWDSYLYVSTQPSSSFDSVHPELAAPPYSDGWVRDSKNGLLYWVPPDCRTGLESPALFTIPPTSHNRSVTLDFEEFVFGASWTQIFNNV